MKKLLIFVLSLLICLPLPVQSFAKETKDKETEVKSSVLMSIDTKEILLEDNAYEHLSPASVTKVMSILLIMEAIDSGKIKLDDTVTASENAVSKGGSQIWLEVGEKMSVEDLLKAVIISSANDACTLLAEYIAGSDTAFVSLMNKKVKELGLKDTNFENCTGLDDDTVNHYSCAYDLAVISSEVIKYDLVKKYSTVWLDSLRGGETELNNTNKLVNKYNGITGLKTGTTSNAGFCLSATAEREGMNLVAVVLGAKTSNDRFDKCRELLDYGFANYKIAKLELDSSKIESVKIKNGTIKSLTPQVVNSSSVVVNKNSGEFEYEYKLKDEVTAPVKKGDLLGEVLVLSNNEQVACVSLVADTDVQKVTFSYILLKLIKFI